MAKWLNHVAIAAPRNGTATHTVNPASDTAVAGANFTPTAGRLLLVVIDGAVTSYGPSPGTPPSGWTQPTLMSAVGNSGLYGWWRTAAGSDTLTVTHNASNFPACFHFFEFAAGSTFVGTGNTTTGLSSVGSNPEITGLTGTNLVMAAKACAKGTGSTTSGAWAGPNVEILDHNVIDDGTTDGYWLGIGYLEDYTSATYAPLCTVTNIESSAEALTWAINVASSNPIPAENALTGYAPSNWQIVPTSDTASTSNLNAVGFTTAMSVQAGSSIDFKIHTGGVGYDLEILRLGWYGGNGARLVTTMSGRPGVTQSEGVQGGVGTGENTAGSYGSRDCSGWTVTDTWSVPSDAVHGVYLGVIKRTGHSGVYSHVGPFVVHTTYSASSKILCKLSDLTWRAYNSFGTLASPAGGKSLYGVGSGVFAQGDRAWSVTYDAPLMTATGALQTSYWNGEQPVHTWLERNGYDVAYAACLDVEANASILLGRSVIMSVGHDEYWTQNIRDAWDAAINAGVHAVVMSGNTMLWRVRMSGRTVWCYKNSHSLSGTGTGIDPVSWTGTFRDTRWTERRAENESIGTMFVANGIRNDEMEVIYAYKTAPIWRNIATIAALTVGTAETLRNDILGFEWDSYEDAQYPNSMNYPPGFLTLSFKTFSLIAGASDENGAIYTTNNGTADHFIIAFKRGTSVTVNFGTNQWGWGLSDLHFRGGSGTNLTMKQATVNLFADLGCQPATLESLAGLAAASDTLGSWSFPTLNAMDLPSSAGVSEGLTLQVNAAAVWSNGLTSTLNPYATWETSNASIATVSARGVVTGVAPGVCTITATYGAASDTTTLTVTASLGAEHVWTGTLPGGQTDGTALELGTYFTVSEDTELIGVRIWNPGQMAPEGGGNRLATLWSHNGTGGSATTLRSIDVPDLLPAGWSEHAFSTPYTATTGVNYCVSYWVNGTATVQDYGATVGGLTTAMTTGTITFPIDGGRFVGAAAAGTTCPTTAFAHNFYGVDVLYEGVELEPGGYTELEWNLTIQDPAVDDDIYEFRVYAGTTPLDTYLETPQLTVGDTAGPIEVAIPTAILRITPQLLAAAGAGDTTATIPAATLRIGTQPVTATGAGAVSTTIPTATMQLGPQAVTGAATGDATALVPTATLHLGGQATTAAGVGTAAVTVPTATLILDGRAVQISGADILVDIPTATLVFTAPLPVAAGVGTVSTTIPVAALRLGPQPVTALSDPANIVIPTAQMRIATQPVTSTGSGVAVAVITTAVIEVAGRTIVAVTGATALIPPASLLLQPRVPPVSGVGTAAALVPFAQLILAAQSPTEPGLAQGLVTCAVDGPALRRVVTGPALVSLTVVGPALEPIGPTGPARAARTATGPALTSRVVAGPAHQAHDVHGPDVSRDVTGPAIDEFSVTGPGACDAD